MKHTMIPAKKDKYEKIKDYMRRNDISVYNLTDNKVKELDKKFNFKALFYKSNEVTFQQVANFRANVNRFIEMSAMETELEKGFIDEGKVKLLTCRVQDLDYSVDCESSNFVNEVIKAFDEDLKGKKYKALKLTKANQKALIDKNFKFDYPKFDEHIFGNIHLYTRCKPCLPFWNPSYIEFTEDGYNKLKNGIEVEYILPVIEINNDEGA